MTTDPHRELKLAILLVATAAIIVGASASNFVAQLANDRLDSGPRSLAILLSVGGLTSLPVIIAVAIWVDRRGPHPVMAISAAIAGLATLILVAANSNALVGIGLVIAGIGGAGTLTIIFYATIVRGSTTHRGLTIGAVAAIFSARGTLSRSVTENAPSLEAGLAAAAVILLVAAFLLYRYLPKLLPASPASALPAPAFQHLWTDRQLRRVLIRTGLMLAVAHALDTVSDIYLPSTIANHTDYSVIHVVYAMALSAALGILFVGFMSDLIPIRHLFIIVSATSLPIVGTYTLFQGPIVSPASALLISALHGGLLILPWLYFAHHVPISLFIRAGILISTLATVIGGLFIPLLGGFSYEIWGSNGPAIMLIPLSLVAIALATRFPARPLPQPID
jgi:hypothetical protein